MPFESHFSSVSTTQPKKSSVTHQDHSPGGTHEAGQSVTDTHSSSLGQGLLGHGMKGVSPVPSIWVRGIFWGGYVCLREAGLSTLAFDFFTMQPTYMSAEVFTGSGRVSCFMRKHFLLLSSVVPLKDTAGKCQWFHKAS